jgi:hypothetical protein
MLEPDNPAPQTQDKHAALLRLLKAALTLPAQITFYASALGAIALMPQADLPTTLAAIASTVGVKTLSSILERATLRRCRASSWLRLSVLGPRRGLTMRPPTTSARHHVRFRTGKGWSAAPWWSRIQA